MIDFSAYKSCTLCPRNCRVDRSAGEIGICGETAELRIASIGEHHGEEPPISGTNGSGTVFLTGCSMHCAFCQNYDISCLASGDVVQVDDVVLQLKSLYRHRNIHNVNFVTPDHFIPHIVAIVRALKEQGVDIPIVYNTSGFSHAAMIHQLNEYVDIYMPDFKFADAELARRQANAPDYPQIALKAIRNMVDQKGFLDVKLNFRAPARRGVFIRHLVLPGYIDNSIKALDLLVREFGRDLPINIMSQFWPARKQMDEHLNRRLHFNEYETVVLHAEKLGFTNLLTQPLI